MFESSVAGGTLGVDAWAERVEKLLNKKRDISGGVSFIETNARDGQS